MVFTSLLIVITGTLEPNPSDPVYGFAFQLLFYRVIDAAKKEYRLTRGMAELYLAGKRYSPSEKLRRDCCPL